jgi:DNA-binding SARP family transcriptional activator
VDARHFSRAVKARDWAKAEQHYGGEFLAGERDEWAVAIREGLRLEYLFVLEQLIQQHNGEGRPADALRLARKLVRLDPMRESGYQLLMHFAAAQRDFAMVHAAFYQCERLMRTRLNTSPNLATRTTYERCAGIGTLQRPAVQHVFAY